MRYKIITSCTSIYEYTVEADSKEEAEQMWGEGNTISGDLADTMDEQVDEVQEIK